MSAPFATVKASRRTGCAVVTVQRAGRTPHHHRVSLRRYAALREWTHTGAPRRWVTSGGWVRSGFDVALWEVRQ